MKRTKKHIHISANVNALLIHIACIAALAAITAPLLLIAGCNYPSADDWSHAADTYKALSEGGGLLSVLKASFETVRYNYFHWEGRYANVFLASLQPGIWGEKYYGIVTWLMLGMLIFSEIFLCRILLCAPCTENGPAACAVRQTEYPRIARRRKWLCIPVMVPSLLLQILYCPFPEESFYWYTGSVNYTFIYGLSLILLTLCVTSACAITHERRFDTDAPITNGHQLDTGTPIRPIANEHQTDADVSAYLTAGGKKTYQKGKSLLSYCLCCILAILVGGDNYATSLSCFLALLTLCVIFFFRNRKVFYKICLITLLEGAGLLICVLSPANQIRINANFAGMANSAPQAIILSLVRSFTNIYSWTNLKVILMILFILPFVWKLVKDMTFSFRFPGFFTLFTFGLYASQVTATLYIDGTTGGGRMAAILFYSYYIWVVGNVCYWTGWLVKRSVRIRNVLENLSVRFGKYILFYCAAIGLLIAGIIYTSGLHETTAYKAYRNWRQGWAQQYAAEWEERLSVLHDENVREACFAPLSVYPEMLMYTDLQEEDGYIWVNDACALYYGKESVRIIPPDRFGD